MQAKVGDLAIARIDLDEDKKSMSHYKLFSDWAFFRTFFRMHLLV